MDGRTDGQTEFSSLDRVCIPCSAVKTLKVHILDSVTAENCYLSVYTVSKNCANLFSSELRQISTTFDNFWQNDGKEAIIMRRALVFDLI